MESLHGTDIGECYAAYRDMLDRYRLLTFGMIIAKVVEALQQDPAIHERIVGHLRHLIVDEYQDINPAQERLIELLSRTPASSVWWMTATRRFINGVGRMSVTFSSSRVATAMSKP